jgi:aerobic-type carbon monoxide dehydrogenase small subunit (CoxS/CutS family)
VILTAKAYLDKNPKATGKDIQQALSGVLCRCFSHVRMYKAIEKYAGLAKNAVSASAKEVAR